MNRIESDTHGVVDSLEPQSPGRPLSRELPEQRRWGAFLGAGAFLLAVGALLAAVISTNVAAVDASDLRFNAAIFDWSRQQPPVAAWAMAMQIAGSVKVASAVGVVFAVILLIQRRWRWAVWFSVVALGGAAISEICKQVVARPRPVWQDALFTEKGYSFPSGHTLSGIAMWGAMGIVLLYILPRSWSVVGWVVVVFGVSLGVSRWALGVHWITDVLGGWLFGLGWLLAVTGVCLRFWGRRPREAAST